MGDMNHPQMVILFLGFTTFTFDHFKVFLAMSPDSPVNS